MINRILVASFVILNLILNLSFSNPNDAKLENLSSEIDYNIQCPSEDLFQGITNYIQVSINSIYIKSEMGTSISNIQLNLNSVYITADESEIKITRESYNNGSFKVFIPMICNTCNLNLYSISKNGIKTLIKKQSFNVKKYPRPHIKFNNLNNTNNITLTDLKNQDYLEIDDLIADHKNLQISSYKFTCVGRQTNGPKVVHVQGSSLEAIKPLLARLGIGDIILFEHIIARNQGNLNIFLNNFGTTLL